MDLTKVNRLLQCLFILSLAEAFQVARHSRIGARTSAAFLHSHTNANEEASPLPLSEMVGFFRFMVDPARKRFYYECYAPTGVRTHRVHPIRDLAAAWDATKALRFCNGKEGDERITVPLRDAIITTLESYSTVPAGTNGKKGMMVAQLPEPPNIARSALLILATTGALRLSFLEERDAVGRQLDGLTLGLLSMQQENGAFRTEFLEADSVYRGIDFYPGEAMLALADVYHLSRHRPTDDVLDSETQRAIAHALERAFDFYSHYYYQNDPDTNYNIWQIQALSKFHAVTGTSAPGLTSYVLDMCQDVVNSNAWKYELARGRSFYPNLQTVEIACGLDALVDGIQIAADRGDERTGLFVRQAENAIEFLSWSLDQIPDEATASRGGLGYGGTTVLEQRLDVTGHAISALTKWDQLRLSL